MNDFDLKIAKVSATLPFPPTFIPAIDAKPPNCAAIDDKPEDLFF